MSLDALEQALFETKLGDGEKDATDVISRLLELPRAVIDRVLFTAAAIRDHRKYRHLIEGAEEGADIPPDVRKAIEAQIEPGLRRAYIRIAMQNGDTVGVSARRLVGDDPGRICAGCPLSLECVNENLSEPETCVTRGIVVGVARKEGGKHTVMRAGCDVKPQKISGNAVEVTCDHPKGTWTLDIMDLKP